MSKTTMSTVDKALAILRHFSVQAPEFGLSELARRTGYDKTTTLRCMTALERNGYVEQDIETRKYRLGLAPLNLAQIREQSFPVQSVLKRYLDDLADSLGETAHATLLMGLDAVTVGISEPDRALRIHVDPSGILPAHATASGIAITAFSQEPLRRKILKACAWELYTPETPTSLRELDDLLCRCRKEALARAQATFEEDVIGTAAPFFGASGAPTGTIAVAAVAHRLSPELQLRIDAALRNASARITDALGGVCPDEFSTDKERSA